MIVIAPRLPGEYAATVEELAKLGLPNDGVYLVSPWDAQDYEIGKECPYWQELGAYGSWFWLKVRIAEQFGVTHFVDEGAQLWTIFNRFLPSVIVHRPTDLNLKINAVSGSGTPYSWHCGDSLPYTRYGDQAEPGPWRPKAYGVSFTCDIEALLQFVRRWDGVVYTFQDSPNGAMVVIPAEVNIGEVLEAEGNDTIVFSACLWTP